MKVRMKRQVERAVREFTDREAPRAAFWKQYAAVKNELSGEPNVHVLTYYGIGGIGKTSLVKQLMHEMDQKNPKARYVYLDFGLSADIRRNLYSLKTKLEEKTHFTFPLLELGLYAYSKKVGEKADSPEVKQLTERSPLLRLMMSVLGNVPVLGMATSVLSLADEATAYLRNHLKMHSKELAKIEAMEAERLYQRLPMLFALDMQHNMEEAAEPVVFFLDTYEQLVNEMSQIGEPLRNDEWLRGDDGLVQNIPGVLWVIAGREKLKWVRLDSAWDSALEQHLLGSLSEADSILFLERAGVEPLALRRQLRALTRGTPIFLDLCVDQYQRLAENGQTPRVELFGRDTYDLTERFIRYMGDAQKDHVFFLACLQSWTPELIDVIAEDVLPNFSLTTYEKIKDYSFVVLSDERNYHMQQTVGEVLREACPESIRRRIGTALLQRFVPVLEQQERFAQAYAQALEYVTRGILLCGRDRAQVLSFYREKLEKWLDDSVDAGQFPQAKRVLLLMMEEAEKEKGDGLYAAVLYTQARYARAAGDYTAALRHCQMCWQAYAALQGQDGQDTLKALGQWAIVLDALGEHTQALEKKEEILAKRQLRYGQDDLKTLWAMHNLAVTLGKLNRHAEARELQLTVLEKRSRILGPQHADTVWAKLNLANTLRALGELTQASTLQQEVVQQRCACMGEEHPDTLWAMHNLAMTLCDMQASARACDLLQEVAEKRARVLGQGHPDTLWAMRDLAAAFARAGRQKEAETLEKELEELRRLCNPG